MPIVKSELKIERSRPCRDPFVPESEYMYLPFDIQRLKSEIHHSRFCSRKHNLWCSLKQYDLLFISNVCSRLYFPCKIKIIFTLIMTINNNIVHVLSILDARNIAKVIFYCIHKIFGYSYYKFNN